MAGNCVCVYLKIICMPVLCWLAPTILLTTLMKMHLNVVIAIELIDALFVCWISRLTIISQHNVIEKATFTSLCIRFKKQNVPQSSFLQQPCVFFTCMIYNNCRRMGPGVLCFLLALPEMLIPLKGHRLQLVLLPISQIFLEGSI